VKPPSVPNLVDRERTKPATFIITKSTNSHRLRRPPPQKVRAPNHTANESITYTDKTAHRSSFSVPVIHEANDCLNWSKQQHIALQPLETSCHHLLSSRSSHQSCAYLFTTTYSAQARPSSRRTTPRLSVSTIKELFHWVANRSDSHLLSALYSLRTSSSSGKPLKSCTTTKRSERPSQNSKSRCSTKTSHERGES
jgi:hypothetical protein